MDVAHELDSSGWKTTLRGLMRIDYGFGAKKPIVDVLKEMIEQQTVSDNVKGTPEKNPNDPPYLNFVDYLTKTKGRKSPFRLDPTPKKEPLTDAEQHTANIEKQEKQNLFYNQNFSRELNVRK